MGALWQDLRFGLRTLWRNAGFTVTAALMLALGVGANTTVFCWVQTIVLHPLRGVSRPSRLMSLIQADAGGALSSRISYPDFRDLAGLQEVFAGVIGTTPADVILNIRGSNQWASAQVVTANTFNVLGVTPERGRTFLAEEDVGEGGHPVVVISHGLWQREFGGNPNIVGSAVRLNQQLFTIVGVLPPEFTGVSGGAHTDVWAPLSMHEYIFHPTDNLHATLSRRREDFFQDGEIAMVGSVLRLDNGVLVVLRMRCGEVSAVIVQVVHLLAVVGSG